MYSKCRNYAGNLINKENKTMEFNFLKKPLKCSHCPSANIYIMKHFVSIREIYIYCNICNRITVIKY